MEPLSLARLEKLRLKILGDVSQRSGWEAVGISVATAQLGFRVMRVVRRYAGMTTKQTLIRIVLDQLGGFI